MATRNLVPRATGEGGIGTAAKKWALGWINALIVTTLNALTLTAQTFGFTISGGMTSNTLTVTADTSLDEAVAMSSKAPKISPTLSGILTFDEATGNIINTLTGDTGSIATATPTTIFTCAAQSAYFIAAFIYQGEVDYHATATVINDFNTPQILNYAHGSGITLTISGQDIQVTQNSGGNSTVKFRILRIS